MTKTEAVNNWYAARDDYCSCHTHPPCDYCVSGFSLSLDDYLDCFDFTENDEIVNSTKAYERAMNGIL